MKIHLQLKYLSFHIKDPFIEPKKTSLLPLPTVKVEFCLIKKKIFLCLRVSVRQEVVKGRRTR